jgi:hypothetical protein
MNPSKTQFKLFEIADRPVIQGFFDATEPLSCEYNFSNLFSWGKVYQFKWAIIEDQLVIHNGRENELCMPLGKEISPSELLELSKIFENCPIGQVPAEYAEKHPELENNFTLSQSENLAEYIYLTEKLYKLSGKKLNKKKNLISQFKRDNPEASCLRISNAEIREKCFELAKKWCVEKPCESLSITHEKSAMRRAFDHFEELELDGLALFLKDEIIAFSIFSRQNSQAYTVHYEKFDREYKGVSQVINQETAGYLRDKCRLLNREQDIGLPGLRKAKRSYAPEFMLNNFILEPKA